jgi:hypothetical protein
LTLRSGAGIGFDTSGMGCAECWAAEERPVDWFERYGVAVTTIAHCQLHLTSDLGPRPSTLSQGYSAIGHCRTASAGRRRLSTHASTTRSYTFSLGSLPGRVLSLATRSAPTLALGSSTNRDETPRSGRALTARVIVCFGVRVHVRGGVSS